MPNQGYVLKKSASADAPTPYEAVYVDNLPDPKPSANEAVVQIKASAFNHRDNWITKGMYPGITEGITLGSDCVGVVVSAPNSSKWVGKRVVIDPSVGWGKTTHAPEGKLEILGMPKNGTFAKLITVPEENLRLCPEYLSDHEAAALPLAGVTAYRAVVTKGGCKPGMNVLVTGIGGGVAIWAVQIITALGAKAFVTSSDDAKLERAHKLLHTSGGANYSSDKKWTDTLLKQTAGKKFDLIVDGGGEVSTLLKLAAGGGRIVTFGATASPSMTLVLPQLFLNNVDLMGTAMGSPEDFNGLMDLVNKKKIVPVVDEVFDFKDFSLALEKMRQGKQFGKLVLDHSKL